MMNKNLNLFLTFLKIGALTFGGGYAMIGVMSEEIKKYNVVTEDDITRLLVISEITPGVFAINAATFLGYKVNKFFGALCATIGCVLPAIVIITLLGLGYNQFKDNKWVNYAFSGIQAGVSVLILSAVYKLGKSVKMSILSLGLIVVSFLLSLFLNISVIILLLVSASLGIIYGLIMRSRKMSLKVVKVVIKQESGDEEVDDVFEVRLEKSEAKGLKKDSIYQELIQKTRTIIHDKYDKACIRAYLDNGRVIDMVDDNENTN